MARALGNLIGNCVATVVIAAWEKDLDIPLARQVLAGDVLVSIVEDSTPAAAAAE
jgi:aerobic C4-dicarboxylate transport protein